MVSSACRNRSASGAKSAGAVCIIPHASCSAARAASSFAARRRVAEPLITAPACRCSCMAWANSPSSAMAAPARCKRSSRATASSIGSLSRQAASETFCSRRSQYPEPPTSKTSWHNLQHKPQRGRYAPFTPAATSPRLCLAVESHINPFAAQIRW